jgi:hypothetical protein
MSTLASFLTDSSPGQVSYQSSPNSLLLGLFVFTLEIAAQQPCPAADGRAKAGIPGYRTDERATGGTGSPPGDSTLLRLAHAGAVTQ